MHINLFDSHVHSDNSFDGESSITLICEKAIEYGLSGIAITDHCDVNEFEKQQLDRRMRQSAFETMVARNTFQNSLVVSQGIELGQPLEAPEYTEKALSMLRYDVVIAALHNLPGEEDFYFIDFTGIDCYQLMQRYYEELLRTAQWGRFDVLAHIGYPLRYITGKYGIPMDMSRFREIEDAIFKTLAQSGKALELNTAGIRQPLGEPTATLDHLKRFRALGGELVTIGSDAHNASVVGSNLQDGMEMLEAAGFSTFTFFMNRKPSVLKII